MKRPSSGWRKPLNRVIVMHNSWKKGHARNDAVLVMCKEGLVHWKKISGYHRRSLAETTMYGFKQLLAGKVSLRNYNGQVG